MCVALHIHPEEVGEEQKSYEYLSMRHHVFIRARIEWMQDTGRVHGRWVWLIGARRNGCVHAVPDYSVSFKLKHRNVHWCHFMRIKSDVYDNLLNISMMTIYITRDTEGQGMESKHTDIIESTKSEKARNPNKIKSFNGKFNCIKNIGSYQSDEMQPTFACACKYSLHDLSHIHVYSYLPAGAYS